MTVRAFIVGNGFLAPILSLALLPYSPWAALTVLAASHALILYPTLRPNVQWWGPVVTHFQAQSKEVWLTIDDGPASDSAAVLEILRKHAAPATFFVKGAAAEERPDDVRMMIAQGHGVENHSYSHPSGSFWCLLPGQIRRQIDQCNEVLERITGRRPRFFRAPVGMKNPAVHPALRRSGLILAGWSVRAFDAMRSDAAAIAARIRGAIHPGAILVLHQGRPWSASVIDRVLHELRADGYRFVIPEPDRLKTKK